MPKDKDICRGGVPAAGNAAGLQKKVKLDLNGFSEETKVWSWQTFKAIAKNLTRQNGFNAEDSASMEALALGELLADDAIAWNPTGELTCEQYLAGVFARKLRHAARDVADERSVWTESRRSLDAPCCADDGDSAAFGDLVMADATLAYNSKNIAKPRAVARRNTIKRLQNAKDYVRLERYRAKLRGCETVAEVWIDDEEATIRDTSDAAERHEKAVKEVGYLSCEEDEVPVTNFRPHAVSFGDPLAEVRHADLKVGVRTLVAMLPEKMRAWCNEVLDGGDPVDAYKDLGIAKNDYYKHLLPTLRRVFADYADLR